MKRETWWLVIILLLALILRVYQLSAVPAGLFGDETDVGYQAYSLLTTGRDLYGHLMPFYVQSLSEYRTPLYIYSTVPFVGIFGLNEWGVRLPAVFWGILSIWGIYLMGRKLWTVKVGLFSALVMAISPWHLQYSRASFEVTMLLSFVIFGTYFFIKFFERKWYLVPAVILFASSLYIYSTAVVFVPLWGLTLILLYWREIFQKKFLSQNWQTIVTSLILLIVVLFPVGWGILSGVAGSRFEGISIFKDTVLVDKINLSRQSLIFFTPEGTVHTNSLPVEQAFHNKPTVFTQVFLVNYLRSFSTEFLLTQGDPNFRHSIHEMGHLHLVEGIMVLIGLYYLFTQVTLRNRLLLILWLLLAPIPASLTYDGGFHATRLFLMVAPLSLLAGVGAAYYFQHTKNKVALLGSVLLAILLVFNLTYYFHRYYVHYPVESWRWWHIGFKESMQYLHEHEGEYKKVVINNTYEPSLIRFLFWSKYPAAQTQRQLQAGVQPIQDLPGYDGFNFDKKYYFGEIDTAHTDIQKFITPENIYLVSQRDEVGGDWNWELTPPENIKVLKTIKDPTGTPIFYIVTGKSL